MNIDNTENWECMKHKEVEKVQKTRINRIWREREIGQNGFIQETKRKYVS